MDELRRLKVVGYDSNIKLDYIDDYYLPITLRDNSPTSSGRYWWHLSASNRYLLEVGIDSYKNYLSKVVLVTTSGNLKKIEYHTDYELLHLGTPIFDTSPWTENMTELSKFSSPVLKSKMLFSLLVGENRMTLLLENCNKSSIGYQTNNVIIETDIDGLFTGITLLNLSSQNIANITQIYS